MKLLTLCIALCITIPAWANSPDEVQKAEKETVKISNAGMIPQTLTLKLLDSSVFFINTTPDSLITLDADFGKRRVHCASSNMKYTPEGHMRSSEPIGPKDFALMCFPEKGIYTITAYGVAGSKKPITGRVIVE